MKIEKEFIPYQQALELKELGFDEPCYKNIFKIKSKYYKLNNEEKEALLKGLLFWARQEMNNLHPEQE